MLTHTQLLFVYHLTVHGSCSRYCSYNNSCSRTAQIHSADVGKNMDSFHYIVIGGGTSGLVVASRLTEDPKVTVLVVEAGNDHDGDPLVNTPGLVTALIGNDRYDWNFQSIPQVSNHYALEAMAQQVTLRASLFVTQGHTSIQT